MEVIETRKVEVLKQSKIVCVLCDGPERYSYLPSGSILVPTGELYEGVEIPGYGKDLYLYQTTGEKVLLPLET